MIDAEAPNIQSIYVASFEDVKKEIEERSAEIHVVVEELQGTVSTIEQKIAKNDVVTKQEFTKNKDSFSTNVSNLQSQINNIVLEGTSGDSSAEMAQSRISSKGGIFPTLKSHLDDIESSILTGMTAYKFIDWELGTFNPDGTVYDLSPTSIRTRDFHAFNEQEIIITPITGYRFKIYTYDSNFNHVASAFVDWKTNKYVFRNKYPYYKFVINKVDSTDTPSINYADYVTFNVPVIVEDENLPMAYGGTKFLFFNWESGTLQNSDGTEYPLAQTYRTDYFTTMGDFSIEIPNGYQGRLVYYPGGVYQKRSDPFSGKVRFPHINDCQYRLILHNAGTISLTDSVMVVDGIRPFMQETVTQKDVNNLVASIGQGGNELRGFLWEVGTVDQTTGANFTSTTAIRTVNRFTTDSNFLVTPLEGYFARVYYYPNGTYTRRVQVNERTYFPYIAGCEYRVVLYRNDSTAITVAENNNVSVVESITSFYKDLIDKQTKTIKVMSYNIGEYNQGEANGHPNNENLMKDLIAFRRLFGSVNADILCIQEDRNYFDTSNTLNNVTELYGKWYPYSALSQVSSFATNRIYSKYPINMSTSSAFVNQAANDGITRRYALAKIVIGTKVITVISAHLSLPNYDTRLLQMQELLALVENEEYWIICGDFNAEGDEFQQVFSEYDMLNMGFYGEFITSDSLNRPLDNIITNCTLETAEMPNVNLSNHRPIVSNIRLV